MVLLGFDLKIVCGAAARLPIPQLPKAVKHFEARVFLFVMRTTLFKQFLNYLCMRMSVSFVNSIVKKCTITNAAKRFAQLTMLGDDDV